MADEDDDPVIASYDVCLTSNSPSSALYLLQYSSHRPASKPYNAARSQTPTALRLKPQTGFLEVDVPMLTHEHYDANAGERFGKALADSRTMHTGATYGMAGGFAAGSVLARLRDVPIHNTSEVLPAPLDIQTLGGQIFKPTTRDPVYLIGSLQQGKLHLSHLDAVVQLRPQLHHIDAEEEINQKRSQNSTNTPASRPKPVPEPGTSKVESKAIEIKIRDSKDDTRDRGLGDNARQLRDIQVEEWQLHHWVDEDEPDAKKALRDHLHIPSDQAHRLPKLHSSLSNGDWLDKMSAPREDGKKGLLAKLRGRERERARRKKAEEEKRQRQREATGTTAHAHGPFLDMSSDSALSSPEVSDSDVQEEDGAPSSSAVAGKVRIKEEPVAAPPPPSKSLDTAAVANAPKKRGRPRKTQPVEPISIDE